MDEIGNEFGKGQKEANLFLCIAFAIVGVVHGTCQRDRMRDL